MTDYDPKTSWGKIIRYNKYNTEEYETVGNLIQGQEAIIAQLKELKSNEPHTHKYGYLWKWVKRDNGELIAEASPQRTTNDW